MSFIKDKIKEYIDKSTELTNQGKGLNKVLESNWYAYINSFDELSEELKELHENKYKLEAGKENTLFISANPLELTIPEMISNRDAIDAYLTAGFNKVKSIGTSNIINFTNNLKQVDEIVDIKDISQIINIKDIVSAANTWYKRREDFLDSEIMLIIEGVPLPSSPNIEYDGSTLSWPPIDDASSYVIKWNTLEGEEDEVKEYEVFNTHIDLAVVMTNLETLAGEYLIKVFAKTADGLMSEPSNVFNFILLEDAEKIKIIDILPVMRDGGTDLGEEFSNVGKYNITFNDVTNEVEVIATKTLVSHESTTVGQGEGKWIGIIIETNRDIADGVEINTPTMNPGVFIRLDENEINDIAEQGIDSRNSFIWWLKSETIIEPQILNIRHINDESIILSIALTFTDFVAPEEPTEIVEYTANSFNTFPLSWDSTLTKVLSNPATEIEDETEFSQADLDIWPDAETNFATLTRYVEVDAIGGIDAEFDLVNIKINDELMMNADIPVAVIDGVDIDENNDGYAYTDGGKTYFKNLITFAQKNAETWELIPNRSGASIEYIFKNDGEIVATADGGTLPNIIINA